MNPKLKGNLAMFVSKTFSGVNENALKYLVPRWMSPLSGVLLRLGFGAAAFWIIGIFMRSKRISIPLKKRLSMLGLGALLMFGYMFFLLSGLKYITPITSSIFICLQPVCVFVLCVIFLHDKITLSKVIGIILGVGGALVCILTQKTSEYATNPALGCTFCGLATLAYSLYLIVSGQYLKQTDNITVSKWMFSGGAVAALVAVLIVGWDAPVVTHLWSFAGLVLAFVLIFPSVISYFLLDVGLRYLSETIVSLYGNLILIVAAVVSYITGQDRFSWWQVLAIALMVASVFMVEKAENKTASSAATSGSSPKKPQ